MAAPRKGRRPATKRAGKARGESSRKSSGTNATASTVEVMRLAHGEGLDLPAYKTADSAGLDLPAAIPAGRKLRLRPGAWAAIPTGLALALPSGFEGQVRPRSGQIGRAHV